MNQQAITREVAPSIVDCELTHLQREPINFAKAQAQHRAYCQALRDLGLEVTTLPNAAFPDGVFVEDPAIVVDEVAVITRMGVASRQPEVESLAHALAKFRPLKYIQAPGTLEGGDVLRVKKTLYVGLSGRTNLSGAEQLRDILQPLGYRVVITQAKECLHFKSACAYLGQDTVLINPKWLDAQLFKGLKVIEVEASEAFAANAIAVGDTVLYSTAFPLTLERLKKNGFKVKVVDNSELLKAESALTCMSQIFLYDRK